MEIKKISRNIYEIGKENGMNVPAVVYASEKIFDDIKKDKTLEQARNVACLPGILKYSIALPDAHQGYGFPIGGVAAFDMDKGIISPGGVGYDINCSVRLLRTNLKKSDIMKRQKETADALYRKIPSGVGRGSRFNMTKEELKRILKGGAKYMAEKGYGIREDYMHTEEEGCMKQAEPEKVSERAMKRGIGQLGTIGAGNHFLEVQYVDEIFDAKTAKKLGIEKNQVTIMVHCGSRGLGHQVASDYIKKMEDEYGNENLPDRELINAPVKSRLGKDYFGAMCAAANFAFANKQLITYWLREEFSHLFPKSKLDVVYDVCHNIAKFENHKINGKMHEVCMHRKGATRSFGGQPVIIPGSMGTASYILIGTKKSEELTFGSTVHGAGRVRSRSYAIKNLKAEDIKKELKGKGIEIRAGSMKGIAEEAPSVYKDIDEVVNVVDNLGISTKVARLRPLIVIKG
jgi:tRNA-splicing ligase RtcB